jgi:hypothetical protein
VNRYKLATLLVLLIFTTGCESLKLRNIAKTATTTTVAYVVAGPVPAILNLTTSMAFDEIVLDPVPEDKKEVIKEIKTPTQAVAYVAEEIATDVLYAFIAFLLVTNLVVPWLTRRKGYKDAKTKYKELNKNK